MPHCCACGSAKGCTPSLESAVAPGGARWQPAPVAMNSITPMPTIVREAQVLVDYESDELDLSDRTMCAFAIMLRAVPVMTVDCCTLLCIVHCLGRTFARIVMGIGPPVRFRSVWCRPERVPLQSRCTCGVRFGCSRRTVDAPCHAANAAHALAATATCRSRWAR